MKFQSILPDLFMATKDGINVFALTHASGTTLIDCGTEEMGPEIVAALAEFGPLADIIVTHAHYDHAGGAAAITEATGAPIWMHEADAELVERGEWKRPSQHAGTPLSWLLNRRIVEKGPANIPAVKIKHRLAGHETVDAAGGLSLHPMPGHAAGQIALRWKNASGTSVLFAADTCMNVLGLTQPIIYESSSAGHASILRMSDLARSADLMVFGHGRPLINPASKMRRFAQKFA